MPSISLPLALGVSAAAGLGGAALSASASKSAAGTEANAANKAAQIQQTEFNTTTANEAPFLGAGNNALVALMKGLGLGPGGTGTGTLNAGVQPWDPSNLQNTPGYQFQLQQGEQALTDQKTATGGVGGGNTLRALVGYGQGLAGTEYQNAFANYLQQQQLQQGVQQQQFGQLQTVAGSGQNAAANLGALGAQTATSIGNDLTSGASATAASQVGAANAINTGISGISSNFLLASLLSGGGASAGSAAGAAAGSGLFT